MPPSSKSTPLLRDPQPRLHATGEQEGRREREGQSVDYKLREGVDFSEGGWATDIAAAIVASLYFISSFGYAEEYKHFMWMHGGTAVAHFFGGMAHRYFPNRASDGTGMPGFYISMMLGYAGNCARYGFGWGLGPFWMAAAKLNLLWLVSTGFLAIGTMIRTDKLVDNASSKNSFLPDSLFVLGEALCTVGEITSCIVYLITVGWQSPYALVAVAVNLVGWISVYLFGFLYTSYGISYNPNLMQRIFHYAMLVMLWGIHSIATT